MNRHNPGATPLYAAALTGAYACAELLLAAGANTNAANLDGSTPLLVSCQEGHLLLSILLSSHGASRRRRWCGRRPRSGCTWAEELALRHSHTELVRWLRGSSTFSPLHHIEVLTSERTLSLLHSGCSPVAGCISPAKLACQQPDKAAAWLILRAAAPWSPQAHWLWSTTCRDRAVLVVKIGYMLARQYAAEHGYCAMIDVWLMHVMPHAITWTT